MTGGQLHGGQSWPSAPLVNSCWYWESEQGQRTKIQGLKNARSEEPLNSKNRNIFSEGTSAKQRVSFHWCKFWFREVLASEVSYHRNQLIYVVRMLPPSCGTASNTQSVFCSLTPVVKILLILKTALPVFVATLVRHSLSLRNTWVL